MDPRERDQQIDKWLDDALAKYSEAEPQWGMEQRILARMRDTDTRKGRWVKFRVPAVAAVAVVAAVTALLTTHRVQKITVTKQDSMVSTTTKSGIGTPPLTQHPIAQAPILKTEARISASRVLGARIASISAEQFPRQAVFPARLPMTEEERALMAFARHSPQEVEKVASEQQEAPRELAIQAIKIEPLEAEGFGGGRK